MRLVYLINGLGPGGAERSLAELLPFYLRDGIEPMIVCLRHRDIGVEAAVRQLGCEVRLLGSRSLVGRVRELRRLLRGRQCDLVHTTLFDADVVGRLAAAGTDVPVLTSLVNTSYEPVRLDDANVGRVGLWATRVVDGWTARHLNEAFHAITGAVRDSAVRHLGIDGGRVTVIERGRSRERLGFPGPRRRRDARRRLGLSESDEVVINVARQEYQKGQKHLLEAVAVLARSRPHLVLLVAGREGHATSELMRVRERLGLEERVRFLGDREDVPDLLSAADVFAFPSVYEGLGGAVIEAMALGLPVVASDIPALREVLEEGGNAVLVSPASPRPLAEGIAHLLETPETARAFGARSHEIFEERFTIERSAARMSEFYRTVAGRGGRRARGVAAGVPL